MTPWTVTVWFTYGEACPVHESESGTAPFTAPIGRTTMTVRVIVPPVVRDWAPLTAKGTGAVPGAAPALRERSGLVGTLAVITGRPAEVAVDLGGFAAVPGLIVLGHYGFEQWQDDLRLGVAETHIELDHLWPFACEHQPGVEHATIVDAAAN